MTAAASKPVVPSQPIVSRSGSQQPVPAAVSKKALMLPPKKPKNNNGKLGGKANGRGKANINIGVAGSVNGGGGSDDKDDDDDDEDDDVRVYMRPPPMPPPPSSSGYMEPLMGVTEGKRQYRQKALQADQQRRQQQQQQQQAGGTRRQANSPPGPSQAGVSKKPRLSSAPPTLTSTIPPSIGPGIGPGTAGQGPNVAFKLPPISLPPQAVPVVGSTPVSGYSTMHNFQPPLPPPPPPAPAVYGGMLTPSTNPMPIQTMPVPSSTNATLFPSTSAYIPRHSVGTHPPTNKDVAHALATLSAANHLSSRQYNAPNSPYGHAHQRSPPPPPGIPLPMEGGYGNYSGPVVYASKSEVVAALATLRANPPAAPPANRGWDTMVSISSVVKARLRRNDYTANYTQDNDVGATPGVVDDKGDIMESGNGVSCVMKSGLATIDVLRSQVRFWQGLLQLVGGNEVGLYKDYEICGILVNAGVAGGETHFISEDVWDEAVRRYDAFTVHISLALKKDEMKIQLEIEKQVQIRMQILMERQKENEKEKENQVGPDMEKQMQLWIEKHLPIEMEKQMQVANEKQPKRSLRSGGSVASIGETIVVNDERV